MRNHEAIQFNLRRTKRGIELFVQTSPDVEEYFKKWSGELTADLQAYTRLWMPSNPKETLLVWELDNYHAQCETQANNIGATLNAVGQPLVNNIPGAMVNISFLRFKGISNGVHFICDSVIGKSELEKLAYTLNNSCAQFYAEAIRDLEVGGSVLLKPPPEQLVETEVEVPIDG